MIADSTSQGEIDIYLDKDEISKLEKEVLEGILVIRGPDSKTARPLLVRVGRTSREYLIDLKFHPPKANFLSSRQYSVIISKKAYHNLKEKEGTGERFFHGLKVLIYGKPRF
ncbi:MAG: hypothetical protein V1886_03835 [archaeon]